MCLILMLKQLEKLLMMKDRLDLEQLQVVHSKSKRLIVEAPAGFGKTYTMVQMLNNWINTSFIKNYKRVLCLSFSVSASNRMRESLEILQEKNKKNNYFPIQTTNFHGFCRHILNKYGHEVGILGSLEEYSNFSIKQVSFYNSIPYEIKNSLNTFEKSIQEVSFSEKSMLAELPQYNNYIREYYLPKKVMPYDSIITLALELIIENLTIKHFYNTYFSAICIDEFQDTNLLGLSLIHQLIGKDSKLIAFGDSMQQIYNFLGAIPSLIDKEIEDNSVNYIRLKTNYRFQKDSTMYMLDQNLRNFQKNMKKYKPSIVPTVNVIHGIDINDEADKISRFIEKMYTKIGSQTKFAILFSQNSKNTSDLLKRISDNGLHYFNGLFKENNKDFSDFQKLVYEIFYDEFSYKVFTTKDISPFVKNVRSKMIHSDYEASFITLLVGFLKNTISSIPRNKRNEHIVNTLLAQSLRQSINCIEENLIISTVHGAKGLEWDYVIIANFEQQEFPNYFEVKSISSFNEFGKIIITDQNEKAVKELLNKFYVAFSRAKKGFLLAYSDYHWEGGRYPYLTHAHISCLAKQSLLNVKEIF